MTTGGKKNGLRQICLIAVRLCLIISLWQAPIPWVHHHGMNPSETPLTSADLSTHLLLFHPANSFSSEQDFGWHCHWVLPNWSHALDDTPDDEPPSEERVTFDQATVDPLTQVVSDTVLNGLSLHEILPVAIPRTKRDQTIDLFFVGRALKPMILRC